MENGKLDLLGCADVKWMMMGESMGLKYSSVLYFPGGYTVRRVLRNGTLEMLPGSVFSRKNYSNG